MTPEPIPDSCLPFGGDPEKLLDFLKGPELDAQGLTLSGMTSAEVLADRAAFKRACESGPALGKLTAIICPHCGELNEFANAEGHTDGPREYHASCWYVACAEMTEEQIKEAWAESSLEA